MNRGFDVINPDLIADGDAEPATPSEGYLMVVSEGNTRLEIMQGSKKLVDLRDDEAFLPALCLEQFIQARGNVLAQTSLIEGVIAGLETKRARAHDQGN